MNDNNPKSRDNTRLSDSSGRLQPPCLDKTPGQCRGCLGWDHMLEAARSGAWSTGVIRCDCTGLTLKIGGDKTPRNSA